MAEVHPWKYMDPERGNPSRKGMLLSNEIHKFCLQGLLIAKEYFEPSNLRPAAYTLRIGEKYVDSEGKIGRLDAEKNPYLKMEPNSIIYVSAYEKLDLPYYIGARFNLRVKWVYKGILLGTGPQVEPGYCGFLSCPLFNLTDRPIRIKYLDNFATIDFERTTDLCPSATIDEITKLPHRKTDEGLEEIECRGQTYLLFPQTEYPPLKHRPDHDVISSLVALQQEVRTWRHIGVGFAVSFLALTLALLGFGVNVYRQATDLGRQVNQTRTELRGNQESTRHLETALQSIRQELVSLERRYSAAPKGGTSSRTKK